jgi:hypothetical protein
MLNSAAIIIDQDIPLSFEGFLFNEWEQANKQPAEEFHIFHLQKNGKSFARMNLFFRNGEAQSPSRAPFGSIEFHENTSLLELKMLLNAVYEFCEHKKINKISIVSYPFCYQQSNSELLQKLFLDAGYSILTQDLNFHIPVDHLFESHLHVSEKRKLKKCLKENFTFKLIGPDQLHKVFPLIKHARERKGFPLSIQVDEFIKLFKEFPQSYYCFSLWDNEELIAVATGVRVSSGILYYFLPADNSDYHKFSPMVLLLKHMYDFCIENNYKILDLGIATANGVRNEGLIRFKENLGGKLSNKYTFVKIIGK